jgi:ACR3 family arsenite efflux pump ArsB
MTLERPAVNRLPVGMKALQEHVNKSLLGYVLVAIAPGLAIGEPSSGSLTANQQTLAVLTNVAVFLFLIVYPMMINLKPEALLQTRKNAKGFRSPPSAPSTGRGCWAAAPLEPWLISGVMLIASSTSSNCLEQYRI